MSSTELTPGSYIGTSRTIIIEVLYLVVPIGRCFDAQVAPSFGCDGCESHARCTLLLETLCEDSFQGLVVTSEDHFKLPIKSGCCCLCVGEQVFVMSEPVDPRLRHGTVRNVVPQQEEEPKPGENEPGIVHKSTDIATAKPSDVESSGFVTTPDIDRSNSFDFIRGSG